MKANNLLTAAIVSGSLGMVPVFVQAGGDDWRGKPERFGYEERGYEPRSGDASSLAPHIGDKEMMTESEGDASRKGAR